MLFLLFVLLGVLLILAYSLYLGITPTPSSKKIHLQLLSFLKKEKAGLAAGRVLELGSGWGGLSFSLAKTLITSQVIGYELSPIPWVWTKIKLFFVRQKNLKFTCKNFYKASLKDASIIVCYLFPGGMRKLKKKFENEVKDNTLIISITFAIPGWKPTQVIEVHDLYKTKIFLYLSS